MFIALTKKVDRFTKPFSLKVEDIHAELNSNYDFQSCDIIIVALPTNYDEDTKTLNTNLILDSIKAIRQTNKNALIIIKSTIPIGFMAKLSKDIDCSNLFVIDSCIL